MSQERLAELAMRLHRLTARPGTQETALPGVHVSRYDDIDRRTKRSWRACLAIVAQGTKEVVLGRTVYRCAEGHYTVAPLHLPVISRIAAATPRTPFLALLVDLSPLTLAEVAAQIGDELFPAPSAPVRALFRGQASEPMLDAAGRLTRLFETKDDWRILGALVVKELAYHVLRGAEGPAIAQFVHSGTKTQRVAQAAFEIRSNLDSDLDVDRLARTAAMSRSAFFKHFKGVTSLSPIQYQKRLRLLEARQLMVYAEQSAEGSAYTVGYQSASQFSREYARMFGESPSRHAARLRRAAIHAGGDRSAAQPRASAGGLAD